MQSLALGPQGNQTVDERLLEMVEVAAFENERVRLINAIRDLERHNDPEAARLLGEAIGR